MVISHLRQKLDKVMANDGVSLDDETSDDFLRIMEDEDQKMKEKYPEDSFKGIFWRQQKEAAQRSSHGMRWHPLMIRWCIYLKHQSSKAYDTLRDSKCIHLPSQRILRDYTNCVKAAAGFSVEVDHQLMQAATLSTCEDWKKLVVILLDEMHVREDLIL